MLWRCYVWHGVDLCRQRHSERMRLSDSNYNYHSTAHHLKHGTAYNYHQHSTAECASLTTLHIWHHNSQPTRSSFHTKYTMHMHSWLHRARWRAVHCVRSWLLQGDNRLRRLHRLQHIDLLPVRRGHRRHNANAPASECDAGCSDTKLVYNSQGVFIDRLAEEPVSCRMHKIQCFMKSVFHQQSEIILTSPLPPVTSW
jgi:hypothetical protein